MPLPADAIAMLIAGSCDWLSTESTFPFHFDAPAKFCAKLFGVFAYMFDVFARFSLFSDVFGCIRTCSDTFGPVGAISLTKKIQLATYSCSKVQYNHKITPLLKAPTLAEQGSYDPLPRAVHFGSTNLNCSSYHESYFAHHLICNSDVAAASAAAIVVTTGKVVVKTEAAPATSELQIC